MDFAFLHSNMLYYDEERWCQVSHWRSIRKSNNFFRYSEWFSTSIFTQHNTPTIQKLNFIKKPSTTQDAADTEFALSRLSEKGTQVDSLSWGQITLVSVSCRVLRASGGWQIRIRHMTFPLFRKQRAEDVETLRCKTHPVWKMTRAFIMWGRLCWGGYICFVQGGVWLSVFCRNLFKIMGFFKYKLKILLYSIIL